MTNLRTRIGAAAAMLIALTGCTALRPPKPQTPAEAEALKIIQKDLQVLPIFDFTGSSAFPISRRNAVMAAHARHSASDVVCAAGSPMVAPQNIGTFPHNTSIAPEKDWVIIHAREDRFNPNIIDPTVKLSVGDLVFIGGFPVKPPVNNFDPVEHAQRKPEFVMGRVLTSSISDGGGGMVWLLGPPGDFHGCSGGPAAIVDESGQVRVFGDFTLGYWIPFGQLLGVTRLPQSALDKFQYSPPPYPTPWHAEGYLVLTEPRFVVPH